MEWIGYLPSMLARLGMIPVGWYLTGGFAPSHGSAFHCVSVCGAYGLFLFTLAAQMLQTTSCCPTEYQP